MSTSVKLQEDQIDEVFHVGLCLAGAISAGAYTAGVIDFLLEALEEWERRKTSDPQNTPLHKVKIPLIGGASAGGMTALIAAAAMYRDHQPVRYRPDIDVHKERPENPFFHSWVDLLDTDMFPILLDPQDINDHGTRSLFNSDFIDRIADRTIVQEGEWVQRNYVEDQLKIFTTLTNLEGFRFNITFNAANGGGRHYYMSSHADIACFKLNGSDYGNDGWIPLDLSTGLNLEAARNAAMATGAFPIGLRARGLGRTSQHVNDIRWIKALTGLNPIAVDPYSSFNVDGGLIDNEPFEKVRDILNGITGEGEKRMPSGRYDFDDYSSTRSTVLLVDPFPSTQSDFKASDGIVDVIGHTMGAVMGHLRLKSAHLADAFHSQKAGQFAIAPSRSIPMNGNAAEKRVGSAAIACGTLGGFGGFIHREFRVHDFFLGRANCQKFLRDQFTIPESASNSIIQKGYAHIGDRARFRSRTDAEPGLQIIPLFEDLPPAMPIPRFENGSDWPVRRAKEIKRFRPLVKRRVDAMIGDLVETQGLDSFLLWVGRKIFMSGKAADMVMGKMEGSLREHHLWKE